MIELETDMWKEKADAHVITTNGDVNKSGDAVMGRGCAREAKDRFEGLSALLGQSLKGQDSNHTTYLGFWFDHSKPPQKFKLFAFPVKHHWHERADLVLIERSAVELVEAVKALKFRRVIVPRPGCGNGQLQWKNIKPIIEPILDDRFVVVHRKFL